MVSAVGGINTQTGIGVLGEATPDAYTTQINPVVIYNFPTPSMSSSQDAAIVLGEQKPDAYATQIYPIAVYKIKPDDPTIRAWTFTLDGHDFYVLSLGDAQTLVYDTYSQQWMHWADADGDIWKLSTGRNWIGGAAKAGDYGSQVIVGDWANGAIYFLDPEYPYDDDRWDSSYNYRFTRYAHGQLATKSRDFIPCYGVGVLGSSGQQLEPFTVTLQYSDDRGLTYVDAGPIDVAANDLSKRIEWFSLGSFSYPGRLFRVKDDGVFTRLDSMEHLDGREDSESSS